MDYRFTPLRWVALFVSGLLLIVIFIITALLSWFQFLILFLVFVVSRILLSICLSTLSFLTVQLFSITFWCFRNALLFKLFVVCGTKWWICPYLQCCFDYFECVFDTKNLVTVFLHYTPYTPSVTLITAGITCVETMHCRVVILFQMCTIILQINSNVLSLLTFCLLALISLLRQSLKTGIR